MEIHVLSSETINRIAAGEVVEKPVNVVKELVENSIDAGAGAITIEIKNGGIDLIRVTDNGSGIDPSQITRAFMRHATSKITDEQDLTRLASLGFRGEALSSIASVAQVELITKTRENLAGVRAVNTSVRISDTGEDPVRQDVIPLEITEIGAPDGTSVIVRNIFYNVPVRKKFLKSPQTEAGYITDLVEQFALSHPEISFHYRVNNQEKLHTTGNGNEKELIYRIYGREIANSVLPVETDADALADFLEEAAKGASASSSRTRLEQTAASVRGCGYRIKGYLGRPEFSRSSRNGEMFFVNDRILKSDVLSKALEEGYRTDLMQHRFPFAVLHVQVPPADLDVNVHPSKREVRFSEPKKIFDFINEAVHAVLHRTELIPKATPLTQAEENTLIKAEEKARMEAEKQVPHIEIFEKPSVYSAPAAADSALVREPSSGGIESPSAANTADQEPDDPAGFLFDDRRMKPQQMTLFAEQKLPPEPVSKAAAAENALQEMLTQVHVPDAAADALTAAADRENVEFQFQEPAKTPRAAPSGEVPASDEQRKKTGEYDPEEHILSKENVKQYHIIGQVFETYWLVEFQDKLLMIDQHAAHEKVNFERLMARLSKELDEADAAGHAPSQLLAPPTIVHLTGKEEAAYLQYADIFQKMGYEIEEFGPGSYALRAVPMELYANEPDALLKEIIDEILAERMSGTPAAILYKIASMSCKAAIKGNMRMTRQEAQALIDELLLLDNPYHCPHGRPTMIVMSQQEMERKFKRIV